MQCSLLMGLLAVAGAMELTSDNWDSETAGKTVFIKFQAPWCGHCKSLKPMWDTLMAEYKDSKTALVADVDCTAAGKALCETHGVRGYPTIKWGDPSALEDYEGGRTLSDLQTFSAENLKPSCSPSNLDLCDDDKKKEIKELQALGDDELEKKIKEKKDEIAAAEEAFNTGLKGLQAKYEQLQKDKDEGIKAIKESGLGLMQAVHAHASTKKDEL